MQVVASLHFSWPVKCRPTGFMKKRDFTFLATKQLLLQETQTLLASLDLSNESMRLPSKGRKNEFGELIAQARAGSEC